jgi:histidyl-tRNA synthetase
MAKLAAPSGFRDFLPDEHRKRQELIGRIRASYESFGFEGMDTPAMENLQVFLGKGGGENEKLMFRVLKRGAELERAVAAGRGELVTRKPYGQVLRCDLQLAQGRTIDT